MHGVCQSILKWFTSYLKERKQKTFENGILLDGCIIKCGIPQGCILGPLVFVVYMNDFPSCDLFSKVQMYANDTSLKVASDNVNILERQMNYDICEVHTWLKANELNLNITESKDMIIASLHRIRRLGHQFRIEVSNQPLKRERVYKFHGIEIDESIAWKDHVNKISKNISGGIGGLKRVRLFNLLKRYSCTIHSRCAVWETAITKCLTSFKSYKTGLPE